MTTLLPTWRQQSREGMFNDNGNQDEAAIFEALFFEPRNFSFTPLTTFSFSFFSLCMICRCIDLPLYPFFLSSFILSSFAFGFSFLFSFFWRHLSHIALSFDLTAAT